MDTVRTGTLSPYLYNRFPDSKAHRCMTNHRVRLLGNSRHPRHSLSALPDRNCTGLNHRKLRSRESQESKDYWSIRLSAVDRCNLPVSGQRQIQGSMDNHLLLDSEGDTWHSQSEQNAKLSSPASGLEYLCAVLQCFYLTEVWQRLRHRLYFQNHLEDRHRHPFSCHVN